MPKTLESLLNEDFFRFSLEEFREIKLDLFREAFKHHYENCPNYRRLCDSNNLTPDDIKTYEDLDKILAVSSDAFRTKKPVASVPEEEIVKVLTTSSTTSSLPAQFPLDKTTLERIGKLNGPLWMSGHDINPNDLGTLFFLTPPLQEDSPGMVKGGYLSFKGAGFADEDFVYCVQDGKIDVDDILEKIKNAKRPIIFFGPPFGYLPFVEKMDNEGQKPLLDLGEDARLILTGGWKGVKHDISKEELKEKLVETFNIKEDQIRDGYAATDMMSLFPECKYHKKHVPIWNHISIRDPEDASKPLKEGEEGVVALMASWVTSYPAFCIPGDMGYVKEEVCECGRTGQIIEVTGRAKDAGKRGCAIQLEEDIDTDESE